MSTTTAEKPMQTVQPGHDPRKDAAGIPRGPGVLRFKDGVYLFDGIDGHKFTAAQLEELRDMINDELAEPKRHPVPWEAVDYARLRYLNSLPPLEAVSRDLRGWAVDTLHPVPRKGTKRFEVKRLGEMTRDDLEAVTRYLKAHNDMFPGEQEWRAGLAAGQAS